MKDWKTTLFGMLLAIGIAIQPLVTEGQLDWSEIGVAALVAAITYFTKDKDKNES